MTAFLSRPQCVKIKTHHDHTLYIFWDWKIWKSVYHANWLTPFCVSIHPFQRVTVLICRVYLKRSANFIIYMNCKRQRNNGMESNWIINPNVVRIINFHIRFERKAWMKYMIREITIGVHVNTVFTRMMTKNPIPSDLWMFLRVFSTHRSWPCRRNFKRMKPFR